MYYENNYVIYKNILYFYAAEIGGKAFEKIDDDQIGVDSTSRW